MIGFEEKKLGRLANDYLNNFILGKGGNIGSFGDINFIVSRYDGVITPNNLTVQNNVKIEKFDNLGDKEYSQFRSPKLKTVSLSMKLLSVLADIPSFLNKVNKICDNGEFYALTIGNTPISSNDFIITSWNYNITQTDRNGEIEAAEIQINLEEYIKRIVRETQKKGLEKQSTANNEIERKKRQELEYKKIEKEIQEEEKKIGGEDDS